MVFQVCSTCHEPLEQFWEEEQEEWHFNEATRSSSGKVSLILFVGQQVLHLRLLFFYLLGSLGHSSICLG